MNLGKSHGRRKIFPCGREKFNPEDSTQAVSRPGKAVGPLEVLSFDEGHPLRLAFCGFAGILSVQFN
jgi:hypothetical protein